MIGTEAGYRSIDAAELLQLAAVLRQAEEQLSKERLAIANALAPTGTASAVPTSIATVEAWLAAEAADIRQRAGLITHEETAPVLHRDLLTGLRLRGFVGIGLGWRHLGTETRDVIDRVDCGGGLVHSTTVRERRGVYEVWVGVGLGTNPVAESEPTRVHDPWHKGRPKVAYRRDGEPAPTAPTATRPAGPAPTGTGACRG